MPLILAIEPDHRQASQLRAMARGRLGADLVHAESAEPALIALAGRVPDLILVPALLSPADEAALGDYLRVLDAASSHVQTLIIPVLAANRPRSRRRGVLASLKRQPSLAPEGCDPKEFAEQCATYLERAAAERARRAEAEADAAADRLAAPVVEALAEPVMEAFADPIVDAFREPAAAAFAQPVVDAFREPVVEALADPVVEAFREPVIEALWEPAVEAFRRPVVEALEEPVITVAETKLEPIAEPEVEAFIEVVAERQPQRFIESPDELAAELFIETDVEAPAALSTRARIEPAAEPALDEDRVFEIVPEARALEFIELDLSTLVEELSGPNLAIPVEAPPITAAVDVKNAAEPVEIVEEHVAPLRAAVKWTAIYSPPGRWWPSMQGVAAEAESPASQPSSPRAAVQSIGSRTPPPKAVQDEWGFFDPSRCGFTALLSKLDEITTTEEGPIKQRA